MHLAEGTLPLNQALLWSAVAAPTVAWSLRGEQLAQKEEASSSLVMAGATSLLFAGTLLPLPVPVVGATSHICLTQVLGLLVGTRRIVWPTFLVLLTQAIFFAHGGITTLGVNTITLGFVGPVCAAALWGLFRRLGLSSAIGLGVACALGGLSVYLADAAVLAVALSDAAPPIATFLAVILGFAPVQVPLAVIEAFSSAAMVRVLATRRPDLIVHSLRNLRKQSISGATVIVVVCSALGGSACHYEGIDGSVFGATAESTGHPPTDSVIASPSSPWLRSMM
ncbi:MAG: energy-coupling factor ABC transporter permease, partial [Myxococcota bacterium]